MENKKGLSAIVLTVIIILLALVSIGVVWNVVSNLVTGKGGEIELASKCLDINVAATSVSCVDGTTNKICEVQLMRTGTGTEEISGVKLVFRNDASGAVSSSLIDVSGNIEKLIGKKVSDVDTGISNSEDIDKIEVTVYFEDDSGNQNFCSQSTEFSF